MKVKMEKEEIKTWIKQLEKEVNNPNLWEETRAYKNGQLSVLRQLVE